MKKKADFSYQRLLIILLAIAALFAALMLYLFWGGQIGDLMSIFSNIF